MKLIPRDFESKMDPYFTSGFKEPQTKLGHQMRTDREEVQKVYHRLVHMNAADRKRFFMDQFDDLSKIEKQAVRKYRYFHE